MPCDLCRKKNTNCVPGEPSKRMTKRAQSVGINKQNFIFETGQSGPAQPVRRTTYPACAIPSASVNFSASDSSMEPTSPVQNEANSFFNASEVSQSPISLYDTASHGTLYMPTSESPVTGQDDMRNVSQCSIPQQNESSMIQYGHQTYSRTETSDEGCVRPSENFFDALTVTATNANEMYGVNGLRQYPQEYSSSQDAISEAGARLDDTYSGRNTTYNGEVNIEIDGPYWETTENLTSVHSYNMIEISATAGEGNQMDLRDYKISRGSFDPQNTVNYSLEDWERHLDCILAKFMDS
ncbi:hypothetical protein DFH11DRAFT_1621356 [Phellopilus nigrolimitatus]|nr:hypothetical protein DFH11DRAFT_1621356 [Phellopilus nigrolimitatus]